jgi:hypothetical protein
MRTSSAFDVVNVHINLPLEIHLQPAGVCLM